MRFLFRRNSFRAVAIVAVRNEKHYIGRCLQHLASQGISVCVIDNDSTDGTSEIVAAFDPAVVIKNVRYPYAGFYDWEGLLRLKQQLASEIPADWFMHVDADEIPQAPRPGQTLKDAIRDVDRRGNNAINFDEFVFVPSSDDERWEGRDYVAGIKQYYFFEPHPLRMIRAWKNMGSPVDLASSGGHNVHFSDRRIHPESFVMRHYITLSREYLIQKYGARIFSPAELEKGWHFNRVNLQMERLHMPRDSRLKTCREDGHWDKSNPCTEHFFAARTP